MKKNKDSMVKWARALLKEDSNSNSNLENVSDDEEDDDLYLQCASGRGGSGGSGGHGGGQVTYPGERADRAESEPLLTKLQSHSSKSTPLKMAVTKVSMRICLYMAKRCMAKLVVPSEKLKQNWKVLRS